MEKWLSYYMASMLAYIIQQNETNAIGALVWLLTSLVLTASAGIIFFTKGREDKE